MTVIFVVKRFVRKGVPAEHRPMVCYFVINVHLIFWAIMCYSIACSY